MAELKSNTDVDPSILAAAEPGGPRRTSEEEGQLLSWAPTGRGLLSGLLGLNVVLLGTALLAGAAFNPHGPGRQAPAVLLLLLQGVSLLWMLWFLLWARRQPRFSPHTDHHAGGVTVTVVLVLFSGFSLILLVFRIGYTLSVRDCLHISKILLPFEEVPFLSLQTYLIWSHSRDCIHRYKIFIRSGLMLTLCVDFLLWLSAVTEETMHWVIELEKKGEDEFIRSPCTAKTELVNTTECECRADTLCVAFRKGYEILYPFNMEYWLMGGCMLYVMWTNVGRSTDPDAHAHHHHGVTLRSMYQGLLLGPAFGLLVLVVGLVVFVLYHVWVVQVAKRQSAFTLYYGYQLAVLPAMSACSLAGTLLHRMDRRAHDPAHNPTRRLDVILLVAAALGKHAISYFSLIAAAAEGLSAAVGHLDLWYSLLSLLELLLQNIFIIEGLHHHTTAKHKQQETRNLENVSEAGGAGSHSLLEKGNNSSTLPTGQQGNGTHQRRRIVKEICAFLILTNIMLWIIPAFGAHPQFENGLGKQFYGFTAWFILVNLGQPLSVFYRMHSVGALMELLVCA